MYNDMPKSRRLRRTKRMRGGDATMTTAMPTETTTAMPTTTTTTTVPATTTTVADKLKNATRKATDWLKGWFGVGEQQQPQMGGRRRKTRRHRSRKH
jgi:hypothetical protein